MKSAPKTVLASIAVQLLTIVVGALVASAFLKPSVPALIIGVGTTLAISGFFCWQMYRGRNWARFCFIALVAWDTYVRVGSTPVAPWQAYLNYFLLVASAAAVALLFFPASRAWFAGVHAQPSLQADGPAAGGPAA